MRDTVEKEILKNSIEMLDLFYQVITDGYNPTSITIRIKEDSKIEDNEIESGYMKGWYKEEEFKSPKTILNFEQRIRENFQWSFQHLEGFSKSPDLLKADFNRENFKKIIQKVQQLILDYTKEWTKESKEYLIDTSDGSYQRLLVVHDDNKSMIIEFGNYIH